MNHFLKILLSVLLILSCTFSKAQYFPNLQKQISHYVNGFDSVLLFYHLPTNGMRRETTMEGYGSNGDSVFRIKLTFSTATGNFVRDKPLFGSMEKILIMDRNIISRIRAFPFSSIMAFRADSLNKRECTPYGTMVSDASTDMMFIAVNGKHSNKASYCPEIYQSDCPTGDRQKFLQIKDSLKNLLEFPFEAALIERAKEYDSIILIHSWPMFYYNTMLDGFGIRGDSCFQLSASFGYGTVSYQMMLDKFEIVTLVSSSVRDSVKAIPFSDIMHFRDKSLDADRYGYVYSPFGNTKTIELYVIKDKHISQKKIFAPMYYLPEANMDKEEFIDIEFQLEELLKR